MLYGKVRLTRLKDAGVMYDKTLDRYFYNYLLDYDPRFSAMDKIYLSMRKFGIDGAKVKIPGTKRSIKARAIWYDQIKCQITEAE